MQAVDYHGLAEAAASRDACIELLVRSGHHVIEGRAHARIRPGSALDDDFRAAIDDAIVIGRERTPVQDIEFSVRQLVEMALRALSPGINDPFTAIAVIDRLAASLARAMRRGGPQRLWTDADGKVRLVAATSSFDGLVDLSFNQIRQAGAAHPDVLIHLVDTLGALAETPRRPEQAATLRRHMDAVMETGRRSIAYPADMAELEARYRQARRAPDSDALDKLARENEGRF